MAQYAISDSGITIFLADLHEPIPVALLDPVVSAIVHNRELDELIAHARQEILSLQYDWDDAGGAPINETTFERASDLLNRLAARALSSEEEFPLPTIRPASGGSIDLYWLEGGRTLLINIPATADAHATYSGRRGGDTAAGTIDLVRGRVSHLAAWLTE
jgi:hypothetical protein